MWNKLRDTTLLTIFVDLYKLSNSNGRAISLTKKMNLYKVERIVDRRVNRGVLEYKVKWEGYSDDDCTWQPLKNLKTVEDMVKEFERSLEGENEGDLYNGQEDDQLMNEEEEQPEQEEQNLENIDDGEEYYEVERQEQQEDKGEVDNYNQEEPQEAEFEEEGSFNIQLDLSVEDSKTKDQQLPAPKKVYKHENSHHFSKQKQKKGHTEIQFEQQQNLLPKKSYLQEVEQRTRFITKAPPKKPTSQIARFPQPGELKILQINRCEKTNQLIYLTQFGPVVCFRRHADMRNQFSDELIKFYESKIEFTMIPKIDR